MGAVAVGATIYFGSEESTRQYHRDRRGLRICARARHGPIIFGAISAITASGGRQGLSHCNRSNRTSESLGCYYPSRHHQTKAARDQRWLQRTEGLRQNPSKVYSELTTDHPIDLCRYQVANCYMGRIGLISGGASSGASDMAEAVKTAINKMPAAKDRRTSQGVPTPIERRHRPVECSAGCLFGQEDCRSLVSRKSATGFWLLAIVYFRTCSW